MHPACAAFALASLACGVRSDASETAVELRLVAEHATGLPDVEIVSVQAASQRAVVSSSSRGRVQLLDLSVPEKPRLLAEHDLALAEGEELTSVAFHPREDLFLAAIRARGVRENGRVELRRASDGASLARVATGPHPDSVAISADGKIAAVACEGEGYEFDPATKRFSSPAGALTLIDLAGGATSAKSRTLVFAACDGVAGAVRREDGRFLERTLSEELGGQDARVLGTCEGSDVLAGDDGAILVPLAGAPASAVEPECVAFEPDGARVVVTLQEVNCAAVVDCATLDVRLIGLGTTAHAADTQKDGRIDFSATMKALREPDGVALTPDGRYFLTADEGDTLPKLSKVSAGAPGGGGRTLSVFELASGRLVADTADQIDRAAAEAGIYPDDRSDNKGCEPEMVACFAAFGRTLASVSLERAGGVALVDLDETSGASGAMRLHVITVAGCSAEPAASAKTRPEGVAHLRTTSGRELLLTANEGSGTVSVFEIVAPAAR